MDQNIFYFIKYLLSHFFYEFSKYPGLHLQSGKILFSCRHFMHSSLLLQAQSKVHFKQSPETISS